MNDAVPIATAAPLATKEPLLRWRAIWNMAFPFIVVGAIWEGFAHSGMFPPRLFPPLEQVASAFIKLTLAGILPHHAILTLLRLLAGFAIAAVVGVTIGLAMAR